MRQHTQAAGAPTLIRAITTYLGTGTGGGKVQNPHNVPPMFKGAIRRYQRALIALDAAKDVTSEMGLTLR